LEKPSAVGIFEPSASTHLCKIQVIPCYAKSGVPNSTSGLLHSLECTSTNVQTELATLESGWNMQEDRKENKQIILKVILKDQQKTFQI